MRVTEARAFEEECGFDEFLVEWCSIVSMSGSEDKKACSRELLIVTVADLCKFEWFVYRVELRS